MSIEIRVFAKGGAGLGTMKLTRVPCIGEMLLLPPIVAKEAAEWMVIAVLHLPMSDLRVPQVVALITVE